MGKSNFFVSVVLIVGILAGLYFLSNPRQPRIVAAGTYVGRQRCMSCEGIATTLSIDGNDYTLKTKYLDGAAEPSFFATGKIYYVDTDVIKLGKNSHLYYRIDDHDVLRQLDQRGRKIKNGRGFNYELTREFSLPQNKANGSRAGNLEHKS
ncbi:MAG: copper resistance protein NlpE [Candidatus Margulisbacteria bacterium]|jgi:hypothetical protein|nr:copper resistance protein NlpE [Candidatus Margulisiibacteriota bacterium]